MDYIKIDLPHKIKYDILALGAEAKASFCFVKDNTAYVSKPDGGLVSLEGTRIFETRLRKVQKDLKVRPRIIACDLHPGYTSTRLASNIAESQGLSLKPVQHHHAHIASCIVDNDIKGKVIGIAFDGTGFGLDGNIWGGEFFIGTLSGFKRGAHLKYIPMPGGEASIREPWRMAFSYLYNIYSSGLKRLRLDSLARLSSANTGLLAQIIDKNINSPLTSSMGRLFDAVSALLGICDVARYEGQAAIELEKEILPHASCLKSNRSYNFRYKEEKGVIVIDWTPVIKGVVGDLQAKRSKPEISLKFHNAICYMIRDVSKLLRKKYKIDKVSMSGGVFQNKYIVRNVKLLLDESGFKVYMHRNVPAHDGNIALGQAVLAVRR
ncbi:MAG: carbamoyltransferase HypF [Candidatus Omnitrophica bacterium]|nr:carbamoyltransferase HypF [Candidatus Omnitrophota bacterium]